MRRPALIALLGFLTLAAAAVPLGFGAAQASRTERRVTTGFCGLQRLEVKTLQDRPGLGAAVPSTVTALVSVAAPATLPATRLAFERHVVRVHAAVVAVRHEQDQDLHLVLRDGEATMIAEVPSPACLGRATARRHEQVREARRASRVCRSATVTGVAFFDYPRLQPGAAPIGIELHPVLAFSCAR